MSEVLRPLREQDALQVAALFRIAFGADRPIDEQEIVSWFRNPELKTEWLQVLETSGGVVGYGDIWIDNDELALEVAAPGHWATFLEWAEDAARSARVSRTRAFFPAGHELADVVRRRGYRLWRSAYTMEIDLGDDEPRSPPVPEGLELREYRGGETDALRSALNEAFRQQPFFHEATESHFREFYLQARGFDPSLWLLAWDGSELAGFVLSFPERAGERGIGWVESLGVRPAWRGRGLGEVLLRAAFRELHARGLRRVGLGVDADNETGALRLYERVGMRPIRQGDNWVLDL
ncbi:MAG: GNAT family N-acetyltransferase [Actinomycetota bacterium]|nr:GNAT family N-acetyltransferase [Actinomycetota bacterium]